ncbi:c-type cytochrome [Hyphomicrobium sp.]|jgi:mono/diheme cytochrome c family protein|uniref:c-type cytochrome n=1 Tax=Hyphomicrobium sp. TaxID=82 RepID=UPI002FE333EF
MARFASLLALVAVLLGMPVVACAADDVTTNDVTADDVARGKALAERLCATCHLGPGQGEKRSPSEIPGFRAVAKRPGQSLHGIVGWLKGVPPMMPNHRLTQDEMFLIATYILSLKDED